MSKKSKEISTWPLASEISNNPLLCLSKQSMGNCENHLNVCPPANINKKTKVTLKYQKYLFPPNNVADQFVSIVCLRGGWEKLLRIKSNSSYDTWHTISYFLLIKFSSNVSKHYNKNMRYINTYYTHTQMKYPLKHK